jgi:hypothetical protein
MQIWRERLGSFSSVFLRFALGLSFLSAVADRLGLWGAFGQPNVALGQLRQIRCLNGQAQLVFATPDDPGAGGPLYGC